ncbi:MAG TPA: choice-of-anchor Q domain-containing protein, partial [Bacteroidales bacterium]|nr:choice-of-anchor Q domain-containing protein [Bacteroidales bacterium]
MKKYFIVFSSILLLATFSANAQIIYVKHDATGTNTGNSWENAFTSLQSALGIAVSGDQIWVARGTYKPSYDYGLGGGARYYHFRMIDGVAIYGGFAGTETLVSQRTDFGEGGNNETILSADLNGDDILVGDGNLISISNNSENCYHVFMHPSAMTPLLTNTAILDGFTITGGNADGTVAPYTSGGGILCDKNSPTLNQLIIKYNFAKGGGGITISGDEINPGNNNTKLTNSVIKNNLSSGSGAGVNMANCSADAEVINCTISGNKTTLNPGSFNQGGAGVRIYHRAKFINCIIENNWAPDCTAGGGGAFIDYGTFWGSQGIFFINCTIINNYAKNGGGTNYVITGGEFRNCILWGNTDQNGVSNYIGSSFAYCNTYPLPSGTGNISIYPDFVDPLSKDFRICGNSICVNSGNNAYNSQLSDIRGQVRIQNTTIDMGAYEFTSGVDPIRYYVKHDASGLNNGTTWENAFTSLQSALNVATAISEIWVAKGTYKPSYDYGIGGGLRFNHFRMINGVSIYGGFAGNEISINQRSDFGEGEVNETILSADINDDDVVAGSSSNLSITNNTENCYHVFRLSSDISPVLSQTAILDGFTITGGNADSETSPDTQGGGVVIESQSPLLRNLVIKYNFAKGGGGITMMGPEVNPGLNNTVIQNSVVKNNLSSGGGGGVNMVNCGANAEVVNCIISGNLTTMNPGPWNVGGGGIRIYHRAKFTNCLITNNWAPYCVAGGGGVFIDYGHFWSTLSVIFTGCTIADNYALNYGGVSYVVNGGEFRNCILWGNTDQNGLSNYYGSNYIYCNTTPLPSGAGNISTDPGFVDSGNNDYRLVDISPSVNTGTNGYNAQTYDVRGQARIQGGTIDMGAYEWTTGIDPVATTPEITCPADIYVNNDAGLCTAVVNYDAAVATGTPPPSLIYSHASGSEFPVGTTTVTVTATNIVGVNQCTFEIIVSDAEIPTITCPPNLAINTDTDLCTASGVVLGISITSDNCGVLSTLSDAVEPYAVGTHIITWTVTDASNNSATCQQTVTVTDAQVPTIACPSNVSVNTDADFCTASGVDLGTPTAGDNCSFTVTNDGVEPYAVGTHIITWTVIDASNNSATCEQTLTVTDNQLPVINCPVDVLVNTDTDLCT